MDEWVRSADDDACCLYSYHLGSGGDFGNDVGTSNFYKKIDRLSHLGLCLMCIV